MLNIEFKNILIRDFKKSDIQQEFIDALNNKRLNKFISSRKKKQTFKTAIQYLDFMKEKKYFYLAVFDKLKNELIGTITYRPLSKESYFLGFMVCGTKFIGDQKFFLAVKFSINYLFKVFKVNNIFASTNKINMQSSFFLIKLGFKILGKTHYSFDFVKFKK
jgi:RimJ/RimL family protein N-acetyltransferase